MHLYLTSSKKVCVSEKNIKNIAGKKCSENLKFKYLRSRRGRDFPDPIKFSSPSYQKKPLFILINFLQQNLHIYQKRLPIILNENDRASKNN